MAAKPSTGSLGQTPLCQLLIFLLERKLTGSLVIQHVTGGKSSATFNAGVPVKLRAGSQKLVFGDICVSLGFLERGLLDDVLLGQQDQALGEDLVERGLLTPTQVVAALEEQVYARLEWVASEPDDTIFGFYPDQDFLSGWGGAERAIDPLRAIGRTSRKRGLSTSKIDQVLVEWSDKVVRLHPHARVARFGFGKDVSSALDVLRAKPMSIRELGQLGLGKSVDLIQALSVLALCRHLDVGEEPLAVVTVSSRPPAMSRADVRRRVVTNSRFTAGLGNSEAAPESVAAPSRLSPSDGIPAVATESETAELREELSRKLQLVTSQDYYQILGVDEKADLATIQGAFFALAKQWHPDRLAPALRELRGEFTRVFARMTEAHQVLTQPAQRAQYDKLRGSGENTEEEQLEVQRVLRAASVFQKAEMLAKRGDWAQAEVLAKQASELDPDPAEYSAFYAWVIAKSGQRAADANYDDLRELLSKAVRLQKDNPRIRLYRAFVLKASGQLNEAMREYRAVIDLEPNNVEAAREVRLHRMRAETPGAPEGILSRWFKK